MGDNTSGYTNSEIYEDIMFIINDSAYEVNGERVIEVEEADKIIKKYLLGIYE